MANPSTTAHGNVVGEWVLAPVLTPSVVAPNTTAEQSFTIPGLLLGDFIEVNKPSVQAGLAIINSRVSAANTLQIGFGNLTGATITPTAAETYAVTVTRPENTAGGVSTLTQVPV